MWPTIFWTALRSGTYTEGTGRRLATHPIALEKEREVSAIPLRPAKTMEVALDFAEASQRSKAAPIEGSNLKQRLLGRGRT